MKLKLALLIALVLLTFVGVGKTSASSISDQGLTTSEIVLEKTANITVTAWTGRAACKHGEIWLIEPAEIKLIPKNFDRTFSTAEQTTTGQLLIPDYGDSKQRITIGPYPIGTKVTLGLKPGSFCKGFFNSGDRVHTRIQHNGGGSWTIAWEDRTDFDYNDVYTEVTLTATGPSVSDEITSKEAFNPNPVYRLPWPAGVGHKLTSYPGYSGEHKNINAYDFAMKAGDLITASEKGIVLWVEDSFGNGACDTNYRNRANVVVIQTETGVNQTYVHLQKDSVSKFNIKVGDVVEQGQPVGQAGNSGYSCSSNGGAATHLHIEWQHHCYDLENLAVRRGTVGKPTLKWSCSGFSPDFPYYFTINGKAEKINNINKEYISDNIQKP